MKIAVAFHFRHSAGDLYEFLLLRAFHLAVRFLKTDLFIVSGVFCAHPEDALFLESVTKSRAHRKVTVPFYCVNDAASPFSVSDSSSVEIEGGGVKMTVAELLKAIHGAGGGFPEFDKSPFEFITVEIEDGRIFNRRIHRVSLPDEVIGRLTDFHIHTNLAYCSENMTVPDALRMAKLTGLKAINFSEHSGQLYFRSEDYWKFQWTMNGRNTPGGCPEQKRMPDYEALFRRYSGLTGFTHGFELDVDRNCMIALDDKDRHQGRVNLGAVHSLDHKEDLPLLKREFLARTEALLRYGVPILAHPFRIFRWGCGMRAPEDLFLPVVLLLKKYGAAAEINFHGNEPYPEFLELCIREGVKISLGSDSHNLYEVGFFHPHLALLRELGVYDRLDSVLFRMRG